MRDWNNWLWIYGHIINDTTINTAKWWVFEAAGPVKPKEIRWIFLISSWLCHKLCLEMLYDRTSEGKQSEKWVLYLQRWVRDRLRLDHTTKIHPVTHAVGQFRRLNIVSLMETRTSGQIWSQTKSGKWNVCRNHKLSCQWSFFFILHVMSRVSCQPGYMKTPRQPAK